MSQVSVLDAFITCHFSLRSPDSLHLCYGRGSLTPCRLPLYWFSIWISTNYHPLPKIPCPYTLPMCQGLTPNGWTSCWLFTHLGLFLLPVAGHLPSRVYLNSRSLKINFFEETLTLTYFMNYSLFNYLCSTELEKFKALAFDIFLRVMFEVKFTLPIIA